MRNLLSYERIDLDERSHQKATSITNAICKSDQFLRSEVAILNPLMQARKSMNILELRLFMIGIQGLNPHLSKNDKYFDTEFKTIHVPPKQLVRLLGNPSYTFGLQKVCERMFNEATIELRSKDGGIVLSHIFHTLKYEPYKGLFLRFDDSMKPYLLDLANRGGYTRIRVSQVMSLCSVYAWRLFELLMQLQGAFKSVIKRIVPIKDLRFFLNVPENAYKGRIDNFITCVLKKPIEELNNKTEYFVWFKPIKKGRKIIAFAIYLSLMYHLKFTKTENTLSYRMAHAYKPLNDVPLYERLSKLGFKNKTIMDFLILCQDEEELRKRLDFALYACNYCTRKIRSKTGFIRRAIENNWLATQRDPVEEKRAHDEILRIASEKGLTIPEAVYEFLDEFVGNNDPRTLNYIQNTFNVELKYEWKRALKYSRMKYGRVALKFSLRNDTKKNIGQQDQELVYIEWAMMNERDRIIAKAKKERTKAALIEVALNEVRAEFDKSKANDSNSTANDSNSTANDSNSTANDSDMTSVTADEPQKPLTEKNQLKALRERIARNKASEAKKQKTTEEQLDSQLVLQFAGAFEGDTDDMESDKSSDNNEQDQTSDQASDQASSQTSDQTSDQASNQTSDQASSQTSDQTSNQTSDQAPNDKTSADTQDKEKIYEANRMAISSMIQDMFAQIDKRNGRKSESSGDLTASNNVNDPATNPKDAEEQAHKAAKDAEEQARKAAKDAEKQARKAAKDAEKQARKAAEAERLAIKQSYRDAYEFEEAMSPRGLSDSGTAKKSNTEQQKPKPKRKSIIEAEKAKKREADAALMEQLQEVVFKAQQETNAEINKFMEEARHKARVEREALILIEEEDARQKAINEALAEEARQIAAEEEARQERAERQVVEEALKKVPDELKSAVNWKILKRFPSITKIKRMFTDEELKNVTECLRNNRLTPEFLQIFNETGWPLDFFTQFYKIKGASNEPNDTSSSKSKPNDNAADNAADSTQNKPDDAQAADKAADKAAADDTDDVPETTLIQDFEKQEAEFAAINNNMELERLKAEARSRAHELRKLRNKDSNVQTESEDSRAGRWRQELESLKRRQQYIESELYKIDEGYVNRESSQEREERMSRQTREERALIRQQQEAIERELAEKQALIEQKEQQEQLLKEEQLQLTEAEWRRNLDMGSSNKMPARMNGKEYDEYLERLENQSNIRKYYGIEDDDDDDFYDDF